MQTITIESFGEFCQRMGCEFLQVSRSFSRDTGAELRTFRFQNGGWSSGEEHREPPTNPIALAAAKLEYVNQKLKNEEDDWYNFREEVNNRAVLATRYSNLPGASMEDVAQLHAGKQRVLAMRQQQAELKAVLVDPEAEARRRRMEDEAQARIQRQNQVIESLKQLGGL